MHAALAEKDVHCGIHYPIPLHLLDAYNTLMPGKWSLPVAEKCTAEFVSIPMSPELRLDRIRFVAEGLNQDVAV